jgi:hypothetical protein
LRPLEQRIPQLLLRRQQQLLVASEQSCSCSENRRQPERHLATRRFQHWAETPLLLLTFLRGSSASITAACRVTPSSHLLPSRLAATITVTPGHANQKVAAMLLVQGDPHPTQAPYSTIVNNSDVISIGSNQWPLVDAKGLTWDKRLLIAVGASQNGASASPWSTVVAGSSAPLNGFTEVLDATQFSYLFEIYVREQDSNDAEIPSFLAGSATANQFGASGASAQQQGIINFIRAGAVQASVGPDALEYNDFPARSQPGSGSRPSVGQLWPR